MAKALAASRSGLRRFFSISAFTPPPAPVPPPKADPSPNLFVSGLSKRTTSEGLREAFSKFGEIIQAKVVTDRVSGYSKGFGFVRYASIEDANEGIKGMDGKFLDGWVIFAEYAKPKPLPSQDQPSQPQSNYGYTPYNYSSQASHSTPYYTSDTTSNFPSHASQPTQPPSSNSYQTSQPQSGYYDNSLPPSNYSSQSSHPQSNYASSYFNYSPQTSQPDQTMGSRLHLIIRPTYLRQVLTIPLKHPSPRRTIHRCLHPIIHLRPILTIILERHIPFLARGQFLHPIILPKYLLPHQIHLRHHHPGILLRRHSLRATHQELLTTSNHTMDLPQHPNSFLGPHSRHIIIRLRLQILHQATPQLRQIIPLRNLTFRRALLPPEIRRHSTLLNCSPSTILEGQRRTIRRGFVSCIVLSKLVFC